MNIFRIACEFRQKIKIKLYSDEKTDVFAVSDGVIVGKGDSNHFFYTGSDMNPDGNNFELKADIKTEPGTHSRILIHTDYQNESCPQISYDIQIKDNKPGPQKRGETYKTYTVKSVPVRDNERFIINITVEGPNVVVKVNGITVTDYTEKKAQKTLNLFTDGTLAIQGQSEGSIAYIKNIQIKTIN